AAYMRHLLRYKPLQYRKSPGLSSRSKRRHCGWLSARFNCKVSLPFVTIEYRITEKCCHEKIHSLRHTAGLPVCARRRRFRLRAGKEGRRSQIQNRGGREIPRTAPPDLVRAVSEKGVGEDSQPGR